MTKNEQNRVVAWRLKILRQANDLPVSHSAPNPRRWARIARKLAPQLRRCSEDWSRKSFDWEPI